MRLSRFLAAAAVLTLAACGGGSATGPTPVPPTPTDTTSPPSVRREMRGLWIATVGNIDWPSRSGLSADAQRAELRTILDRAVTTGLNAIVFHVRPAADAVYRSSFEPWGAMLTGTQGGDPGYDPLQFAIEEAHARGLELHAWVNPYRAGNARDTATALAANHVFRERRDLIRVYGAQLWMDPGEPEVQDRTMRAIRDIVQRYDVDAIHLDDYFYPYPVRNASNQLVAFPDTATYRRLGGGLSLADWRRQNVNQMIERIYREVHQVKPTVRVGISPFGIWRSGTPPGITGLDAYSEIYADSRKWLQEGWLDYLAPQLYWRLGGSQDYAALLDWWLSVNSRQRHVWPGLASYRVNDNTASAFSLEEIPNQIRLTRQRPRGTGFFFYNTTWTLTKNNLAAKLAAEVFQDRAVIPASTWLDATPPGRPTITVTQAGTPAVPTLAITPDAAEVPRWWLVRSRAGGSWTTRLHFADRNSILLPASAAPVDRVVVNAVDAVGNMSADAEWRR